MLALLDSDHVDHRVARTWLQDHAEWGWASCAITEIGFVRIIGQPRYPSPVRPAEAVERLGRATRTEMHEFWPCSVSPLDAAAIDPHRLHGPRQVTDAYLLALAVHHNGRLATFDKSVPLSAVSGATDEHLTLIGI